MQICVTPPIAGGNSSRRKDTGFDLGASNRPEPPLQLWVARAFVINRLSLAGNHLESFVENMGFGIGPVVFITRFQRNF